MSNVEIIWDFDKKISKYRFEIFCYGSKMFSLLTQFTYKSYGTDVIGSFLVVDVPEASRVFIGDDVPTKILYGTIVWFFHLVSDVAGSNITVGKSGGTGIPGPLLALAKELSILPFFRNMTVGDNSTSLFLSKLFNGTLLAKHDESGTIIRDTVLRFDLRGELGIGVEIGRQAIPIAANECIVRGFYFIRRLAIEIRENDVRTLADFKQIDWSKVKPLNNPTITRMLTIATAGAFAPAIAVALVGSNFSGLSGAALTSACLAYLGGGAIAIGGSGMAGGTIAIVGGGAVLGIGAGFGVGSTVGAAGLIGKQNTILQSAKLLVSVREIFLNDEHDTEYSDSVYEQYVQSIMDIEKGLVELKLQTDVASGKEKKELLRQIKNAEDSVEAMKIARKSLLKFKNSFEEGLAQV